MFWIPPLIIVLYVTYIICLYVQFIWISMFNPNPTAIQTHYHQRQNNCFRLASSDSRFPFPNPPNPTQHSRQNVCENIWFISSFLSHEIVQIFCVVLAFWNWQNIVFCKGEGKHSELQVCEYASLLVVWLYSASCMQDMSRRPWKLGQEPKMNFS